MLPENTTLSEFANNPDTVDFVIRTNEFYAEELDEIPGVVFAQNLSEFFSIVYSERSAVPKVKEIINTDYYASVPYCLGLLDKQALDAAGIDRVQEQPLLNLGGSGVLIGFVDTGIDYTLPNFRYENGETKIVSIYDQTQTGNAPEGFIVGTEYTREQINEALKSENPFSVVPQNDTVGHGTFLASVAAGKENGDVKGAAPDSELVVVKLKNARNFTREIFLIPEENQNVYEFSAVMLGVEYIINKAKELNKPVAICIGLGSNQGGHDGEGIFEQYLGIISKISGVCICCAAGNESQEKHHARFKLGTSNSIYELEILSETNGSGIFLTLLNSAADRISVGLKSPTGEVISRIPTKSGKTERLSLTIEKSTITITYFFPLTEGSGQATVISIENATSGIWSVNVYGDFILDGNVDAYLPVSSIGYPDIEFLVPDPNYTITDPGATKSLICVGGYDSNRNRLYTNTSWGPTRMPENSPDFVAPAVNILGEFPQGQGVLSGTSVAAAITTGASALLLQWGVVEGNLPSLNTFQIKEYIMKGASRDSSRTYPNSQWGYGRLNLINTFDIIRQT